MSRRRCHYKPPVKLTEGNWVYEGERSFELPALCGRRDWSAATDKLEQVDCKACLRIIHAMQAKLDLEAEQRRDALRAAEQQAELQATHFVNMAEAHRMFRPRVGLA